MNNINAINNISSNYANNSNNNVVNANQFALLLKSMMNSSAASIGDFSNLNGSSSNNDMSGYGNTNDFSGLSMLGNQNTNGLGSLLGTNQNSGGLNSLLGANQENKSNDIIMMLLTLLLKKETGSGNSNNLINNLQGNSSNKLSCQHQFVSANNQNVNHGNIPSASNIASQPALVNQSGERHPQTYRSVIDQFNVENNQRYTVNKQGNNDTYCNIFTWDVTKAMGAEIPHYINPITNEPVVYPNVEGATEMNANATNDWLNKYGGNYGWKKVSAQEAQAYANMGMPAVTSWKNTNGEHGHLQVVSPSENRTYDPKRGVAVAQAGRNLYNYAYITKVYGDARLNDVEYFAHI